DPAVLHGLAMFHAQAPDLKTAAAFEAKFAAKTSDARAMAQAARLYLQAGEHKRAIDTALAGIAIENRAELRNILGKAYEAAGDTIRAVVELREAINLNKYEEAYYFDLAQVLLIHQNFDVAIQVVEASRKIFAESAQLELALGVAYYGQRRFADAVDSFLRVIAIAPKVPQSYMFLGRIIDHADARLPELEERFSEFAKTNPESAHAQLLYARVLIAQSADLDRPEQLLRRSIALEEGNWESHFELGILLERKRQFPEAAAALSRSIQLNPQNPTPHYRLARIYDRMGKREEAAAERALHEKLSVAEKEAIEKHQAGLKRLEFTVK
ncbi:MAG: tetratricopeptide repeat protein, partial [Bryobacteraceae bacterium]